MPIISKDKVSEVYNEIYSSGYKDPKEIRDFLTEMNSKNWETQAAECFVRDQITVVSGQIIKNQEKYKEFLEMYKKMLQDYKKLLEELKVETSIDISTLYSYMLWNGYFSATKTHKYDVTTNKVINGLVFSDVILGRGVCLAYADLLKDIINVCDKRAQLVGCCVETKGTKKFATYKPEIDQKITEDRKNSIPIILLQKLQQLVFSKTLGNHAITLIDDDDKTYFFDPTSLMALNFLDSDTAEIVDGHGKITIKYLSTITVEPLPKNNILMYKDFDERIKRGITTDEVINSFKKTTSLARENTELIDDAYGEVSPRLNEMAKILVKGKKKFRIG